MDNQVSLSYIQSLQTVQRKAYQGLATNKMNIKHLGSSPDREAEESKKQQKRTER